MKNISEERLKHIYQVLESEEVSYLQQTMSEWYPEVFKKETFEMGKYYELESDICTFAFKACTCDEYDNVVGYGIDLDFDLFSKGNPWCGFNSFEDCKEISEEYFLGYIINYLDIKPFDTFLDIENNKYLASREPYIRDGGVYVKNGEMLSVCLFKDGEIGQKIDSEESVWKKTMDLRWVKKGSDIQEEERVLQQKHVEVNTGKEKWENVR